MKLRASAAIIVAMMIAAGPAFAAAATTAPAATAPAATAPATAMTSKAKPVAKTHYYVSQDASTKACSVVTKKPDGKTASMVGKYWYSSKAKATVVMKKVAACKGA